MTPTFYLNLSFFRARRAAAVFTLVAAAGLAMAGPGHEGGDQAPAAASTASPRIQAHSDLFELVGIVNNGQMTVYLRLNDAKVPSVYGPSADDRTF